MAENPLQVEYIFECAGCGLKASTVAPKNAPWLAKVSSNCSVCVGATIDPWKFLGNRFQLELTVGTDTYDPKVRDEQKRRSREDDQRRLDLGEVTRNQLRKENSMFSDATMKLGKAKRLY